LEETELQGKVMTDVDAKNNSSSHSALPRKQF
jgi:hypothetical protein